MKRRAPVVAFSGPSGAGKTRLLARLVPALRRRGLSVAVVKHSGHAHPFDRRGKDTEVLRRAGAVAAAIEGPAGMAYFGPPAGGLGGLLRHLPAVDLVLAEGFRGERVPRVEVHRRRVSREFLCRRDPDVVAVVTDEPPPRDLPAFAPGEVEALADFVSSRFAPERRRTGERRRTRSASGPARLRTRSRRGPSRPARRRAPRP
ncbi:MAG TPA: molybdopterin-guanine dinucleotide biosynthesis protein B [Anaeromyxobacteraceae bacterium]|nr:molybdopterin-guanine dinucleotide biosynthesis protein B [Anaeromyxobacteraceae bacterium]